MAISKIILNGVTQMDLTQDTVAAGNLISPNTAHGADGEPITGTASGGSAPVLQTKSKSYTPSTSQQTEAITADSGYDGLQQVNVTVSAMPSGTAGTPTATKGTVSNHSVSVTPSVTNTTGYITGSTKTGTAVTVSASELASGNKEITQNGTNIDVVGYSTVSVDVQGGSSPVKVGTASANGSGYLMFENLLGEPTSFMVISHDQIATGSTPIVAAIACEYDSVQREYIYHEQVISNTSNAQVSYISDGCYHGYNNYAIQIVSWSSSGEFHSGQYDLIYTYDGTPACINTKDVQVGSGVTSITFTGLEDEPVAWYLSFKSNFSTSSGYQRVIAVASDGTDIVGLEMDSSAHYSDAHWSSSYSNGSLTISSQGTNAGGYFHQPGYYQLTYIIDPSNYQSKTVTPTEQTQIVQADSGYDALKKVTVNPIPSQYIVPSGNLAITSNSGQQTIDIAQYATATVNVPTGGGSVQTDTKTATASDYPTSLSFTGMKGQPKMFTVRLNAQVSSSGSTTYYYIVDITSHGSTTHGNCFRIGSTRRVDNITSGYSWSYSGTTLTITSSASSRSASPGAFYSGSYELMYVY